MGDQYINATGLTAIKNWIVSNFTNAIETVKVNGTALTPDANKAVDIEAAQITMSVNNGAVMYSRLTQGDKEIELDSTVDGVDLTMTSGAYSVTEKHLVDKDYVDNNAGKIDEIKVNGTTQTIVNKSVDLKVPEVLVLDQTGQLTIADTDDSSQRITMIPDGNGNLHYYDESGFSDLTLTSKTYVDGTFRTETQVEQQIDDALADITGIDFQVVQTLPATGVKGTIYLVPNTGTSPNTYDEYIWVEPTGGTAHFEKIGTTDVDLSGYWTMTAGQANSLTAMTVAEIEAILAA